MQISGHYVGGGGGGDTSAEAARETWHVIQGILEASLPADEALIYNRNPSRTGIFFFLKPEHWEGFRAYIEALFAPLIPQLAGKTVSIHCAGSGLYDDIFEIRDGFRLCREYTLVNDNGEDTRIYWIDQAALPASRQRIFTFSLELEQNLIYQLQNANFEEARTTIHAVFTANTQGSQLSERMLRIFYTNIQSCFLKALEEPLAGLWRDAIEDLDFTLVPQEVEETFIELARSICAASRLEYSSRNAYIKKEELVDYVEKHFGEERLSLGLASRHFGFSEPYFSQMFKEITGEKFSTVTELVRMRHAQALLKQYLKVEEVAYRCGYSSPNTFRRAYKRHFGVPPTGTTRK
jgi:AraC-like DNA-binding protein